MALRMTGGVGEWLLRNHPPLSPLKRSPSPIDGGGKSRNADFILIAVGDTTPSEPGLRSGPYPTGPLKIPVGGKGLIEVFLSYNTRNILDFRKAKNEKSEQKKRRRGYAETSQEILYPAE
jgi:hypothetical protein